MNDLLLVPILFFFQKGLTQNEQNTVVTKMRKIDILQGLKQNHKDQNKKKN